MSERPTQNEIDEANSSHAQDVWEAEVLRLAYDEIGGFSDVPKSAIIILANLLRAKDAEEIASLKAQLAEAQWASVSDKLPEVNMSVLTAWDKTDSVWVNKYLGGGKWFGQIPTYWMPLAAAPTHKKEDVNE